MKKVVINGGYGGFGLSNDALLILLLNGFPLYEFDFETSGYSVEDFPLEGPDGIRAHKSFQLLLKEGRCYDASNLHDDAALRSHPLLVHVVEQLGKQANGNCAKLVVVELEDLDAYRIDEYDGSESVVLLDTASYVQGHLMTDIPVACAEVKRFSPTRALLPG